MNLIRRITIVISLVTAFVVLVACGGASKQTTAPMPLGAASGLNTFIFVYSDN